MSALRLCRFASADGQARVGLVGDDGRVSDLAASGVTSLDAILEHDDPASFASGLASEITSSFVRFLPPIERQEVWAAGVTYLRSKAARMEESDFSARAYDKVYDAARPEIFFKCLAEKVVGAGDAVGIRRDATWSVPEPELTLVLSSRGRIAGYTIGNDMSSRDIEGENLLYLPQAKMYDRSCAIGPWIVLGESEDVARGWTIQLDIRRDGAAVFSGQTSVGQIKRGFDELAGYLFRSQRFPHGVMLLTGTGVVPPDNFTLQSADVVHINVSGIGRLNNPVMVV